MNCETLLLYMAILEDVRVFPSAAKLKRMAVHGIQCEKCQLAFMSHVLEWEKGRPIPPPPQAIGRWRLLAQHLVAETEKEDDEAVRLPWGWQLDRDQEIWWWRFELQELEILARAAWSFAGDQALQILRWFVAVRLLFEAEQSSTPRASSSHEDNGDPD